jgi:DNA repair exonuclease SbcCD ATPase subunit
MRNDAQDDIDELPKLTSERKEPRLDSSAVHTTPIDSPRGIGAAANTQGRSNKALGVLSALTIAIACSSAAFGWWSMQRMQLLEQQLIATQNSFSKINEDAAGRISAITGTVTATQNTVLSDNEALKKRLNTLESRAVNTHKQQQISLTENTSRLNKLNTELATLADHTSKLDSQLEAQKTAATQQEKTFTAAQVELSKSFKTQQTQLQDLKSTLASNKQQLAQLNELDKRLKSISSELSALQKRPTLNDDVTRLQQDLLILRSQVDNLPTPAATASNVGPTLADFDAYRAQTNRTITALQKQVHNLQTNTP